MSENDKAKAQTTDQRTADRPVNAPSDKKPLSAEDLDKVSGGINPQPLPPGRSRVSQ